MEHLFKHAKLQLILFILSVSILYQPQAQAETIDSITFNVPINVTNIHPDIMYLAPMCRIFTGEITNNANQLGAVRPDIRVDASRSVRKKLTLKLTSKNLSPGKKLSDVTLYTCQLYIKRAANGSLLSYSTSSNKQSTKAVGTVLVTSVRGEVLAGRSKAVSINTSQLSARGVFSPSAQNGNGVRKPGSPAAPTRGIIRKPGSPVAPTRGIVRKPDSPVAPTRGIIRKPVSSAGGQTGGRAIKPGARSVAPDVRVAVAPQLGPEPVVTSWNPLEITYPGQTLVIEGRDFRPGITVQLQGAENRSINLQITNRTPTRIEAKITTFDYTGYDGAALVVSQQGGKKKTLVQDYKVVNENTTFKGDSLWHVGILPADNIFTRGTVTLTLDKLEFRDSGSGTYREAVDLIILVNRYTRTCDTKGFGQGTRFVREWGFKTQKFQHQVQWIKLADGRIQIDGVGKRGTYTAVGQVNDSNFGLLYNDSSFEDKPRTYRSKCQNTRSKIVGNTAEAAAMLSGANMLAGKGNSPRSTAGVPQRLVEWSLERVGP